MHNNSFFSNLVGLSDSYKYSHHRQYPPDTTRVFSFFESRGGRFDQVTFFGLQYLLKRYLTGPVITAEHVERAEQRAARHFGNAALFNREGWMHIVNEHGGHLPLEIKAVAEGTSVPTGNVLMTVLNTDPTTPWLTNFVETILSQVWYPSTVATQSREMKKLLLDHAERTGCDPATIDFKLHDFGFRGSTSVESAAIGGAAHLVNFQGTDTFVALELLEDFYHETMAGFSIPAAEHSTITSWGRDNEKDAYENMLTQFPDGLVAVVSDSYDIFAACEKLWGSELKEKVLSRDGVLIVRPDSGDPPAVVAKVLKILGETFGYTLNSKNNKVLNPKVRVIQGDGIDYDMLRSVLFKMQLDGWATDNIAFGSGGGLLQKVNRDTQKFAFKCSAVERSNVWNGVIKDPVTDPGKKSKAGLLALVKDEEGTFQTVSYWDESQEPVGNLLRPVFQNGVLLVDDTLADIRLRASLAPQ